MNKNIKDLTGMRFGKLTVQKYHNSIGGHAYWECLCDCGNISYPSSHNLLKGTTKSCGCSRIKAKDTIKEDKNVKKRLNNLTDQRFGRLTVVKRNYKFQNGNGVLWECVCDCGEITYATTANLKAGMVKSCGCLLSENNINKMKNY
jgi:hypothetical protein